MAMTEHVLERGPAGSQSSCFPVKTEQCEVVVEDKQRALPKSEEVFVICNPKPHTQDQHSCVQVSVLFPKANRSPIAGI